MSLIYKNFSLYSNYNKTAPRLYNISRNNKQFSEESSCGHKVLYVKRNIPKQLIGHSISVTPDLVGKNIDTYQNIDINNYNSSKIYKSTRPKSIFNMNKGAFIPKIKLSKRTPSHKFNENTHNINHTMYKNNYYTPKKNGNYTHHHTITSINSFNTENTPSFCLVNSSKYKKQNLQLYSTNNKLNSYKNTIQSSNDDNAHFRTFTNQTLSSLFKIDKPLFKLNQKLNENLEERSINQKNKEITTNENINKELNGKEIVMKQLIHVLNNSNNYGMINQFGSRKIVNYVNNMEKKLKKDIRQKEFYVKDTMDSLKRLQRNNDELASKVAFALIARKK